LAFRAGYHVDALAAQLGITSRCLQTVFERGVGIPPKHWLKDLRMVDARRLLCSDLSRAEVARLLGFPHPQHFTREFIKVYGVTPATFVANARRARHCDACVAKKERNVPILVSTSDFGISESLDADGKSELKS